MNGVVTYEAALEAYFDAWFYSRSYFYALALSVSQSGDTNAASTSWGTEPPDIRGNIWYNQTAWRRDFYAAGTFLQQFVLGDIHRPVWLNFLVDSYTQPPQGPYGVKTMKDFFIEALKSRMLSQSKSRERGLFVGSSGQKNRMKIRIPHT